jgi:hypothetical protein
MGLRNTLFEKNLMIHVKDLKNGAAKKWNFEAENRGGWAG